MLLLSDLHLGKITHFRKHGSALPRAGIKQNFHRLTWLASTYQPETICFLGDLFHSRMNREWEDFVKWRNSFGKRVVLVAGNHDIIRPWQFEEIGVEHREEWRLAGFQLTHHPEEEPEGFNFCGHIHPAVRLTGAGKQWLTLPCFFMRPKQLILPAYGTFTGNYVMKPEVGDRVFVVAEGEAVVEVQ